MQPFLFNLFHVGEKTANIKYYLLALLWQTCVSHWQFMFSFINACSHTQTTGKLTETMRAKCYG